MKKIIYGATLFLLASACTTPTEHLKAGAEQVTVLSSLSYSDLEKLQKIGSGSCEIGTNARTAATNQQACENYLRNEAASKGADYIVFISAAKRGITTANVSADFYKKK